MICYCCDQPEHERGCKGCIYDRPGVISLVNTDLKARKCRGCDKLMIEIVKEYRFTYCEECYTRYSHLMG